MIEWLKNIDFITILGFAAGLLTSVSMLPQLIKTYQQKKAEEVSLFMLIILISGISLWIWYGLKKNDYPIIITNSISLIINIILIYFRNKYKQ